MAWFLSDSLLDYSATAGDADLPAATAFGAAWHELTGDAVEESMRSRLYQLGELTPPEPFPSGQARLAGPADRGLLVTWSEAFGQEAGTGPRNIAEMVDDRLSYRAVTWTVSRPARRAGAEQVVLFTDLANPVSNELYQRLGYQPVADRLVLAFRKEGG